MLATIAKWGNSQGVRIPKPLLENIGIKENDAVELFVEGESIVIRRAAKQAEKRPTMDALFAGYTGEYTPVNVDFGEPVGKEIW